MFLALAVWLAARGGGARRDPVERLIADMVQIPGQDFRMDKYEVTQAQWEALMGENPSYFKGADHPVECVSWDDCQAFLEKLNAHPAARASGLVFRLPTEEEWELACRAGSTNYYFRLADGTEITEAMLDRVAWYAENTATRPRWLNCFLGIAASLVDRVCEVDWSETIAHHSVGRKEPNAWGIYDMLGNVCEWTETRGPVTCINRGGGWFHSAESLSCYTRDLVSSSSRRDNLGFRLCATQSPAAEETHAENAESAEDESHAESAENAE